jgi:PAS domain S-box-containing protein
MTIARDLEHNFRLLERKNNELISRNQQLAKVREIALGVDKVKTIDEVLSLVVNLSREIPGIQFVLVQQLDASGQNVIVPNYSDIKNGNLLNALNEFGFDLEKELAGTPAGNNQIPVTGFKVIEDYLDNPRIIVKEHLSELLDGVYPEVLCDSIQKTAGFKKFVIVPLLVRSHSWGNLLFFLNQEMPLDILEMIGAHCAIAIKNIDNVEAMELRNEELSALYTIAQVTSVSQDIEKLINSSIKEIVNIFGADASGVYLWDKNEGALKLTSQHGLPWEATKQSHYICPKDSSIGKFFFSQEEIMVGNMSDLVTEFPDRARSGADKTPLQFASSILHKGLSRYGLIIVVRKGVNQFSEEEKNLLLSITNQIAVAVENYEVHADALKRMEEAEAAKNELQKALNDLENSEEKFSKAFHSSPEIMFITSSDGTIIEVNRSFTRISGYTREEVLGRKTTEINTWVNPSDRDKILLQIWEAGRIYNEETQFRVKSGEIHTILFSNEVINIDNEPCLIFVGNDITERKKMEDALAREAIRRRILIEQSKDGIVILDENSKVYEANLQFAEMLGYSHEEILNLHVWDWDLKSTREQHLERGRKKVGAGNHFETIHRRKDGSTLDVEISTNEAMFDGQKLVFCVCRDITEHKQAEEKIRESEKRYRLLAENLTDVIWTVDVNKPGRLTYISPSVTQLLGFTVEEALEKDIEEVLTPAALKTIRETFLQSTTSDGNIQDDLFNTKFLEIEMVRKDGSVVPVEINVSFIKDADDRPTQVLIVARDITIRKQAEGRVLESEKYLRTLLDEFAAGAFLIDPVTHTIVDANLAASKMFGAEKEKLIGRICHQCVCPSDPCKCQATEPGQGAHASERILLDASGQHTPILKSISTVTWKGRQYIFESFLDITKRKRAEIALARQKDLVERILSTSPNAVLVIGEDLKIKLANQAYCILVNKEVDDIIGKPISGIMPVEVLLQEISGAAALEKPHIRREFEYKSQKHDLILTADIQPMQKGELLIVINDVTVDRERQDRLYLTDRLASVGQMASGVAHELNNPLTSIIGLSSLLTRQDMPQDFKEDLSAIKSEAQRCAAVVKNLLAFARKHPSSREPVNIRKIIEDVMKLRAYEHKANNISVITDFSGNLPGVFADYFQMQQVFLNIILNAEAAMIDAHGRGILKISAQPVNSHVTISFSDDGPGISQENMRSLFNPFFTTKDVGKGTGLGLSISYGIVNSHGGRIYAESEFGKGATFIVELPALKY